MKTKHVILLVLALITATFFVGRLSTRVERKSQNELILHLNDTISTYRATIGGQETTIYEKNQLIADKEQAIQLGLLEQDRLKALNLRKATQITKLEGQLSAARDSIDLDSVVFVTDTVVVDSGKAESHTYVQLPFSWRYQDQWLTLNTGIHEDRTGWFNLQAPVHLDITLGNRKGVGVSAVTTTSPYVRIDDFTVVNIQEHKWYMKKWIPWAGGFAGGLATGWAVWGR